MSTMAIPADPRLAAPVLAARLRAILWGLAVVITNRLLRTPGAALLPAITIYLTSTARRFLALATHVQNGRLPRGRPRRTSRSGPRPAARPRQHGWLLRHGRHEAAYWRNQLESLLAEPGTAAFLEAVPTAGRLLRPICHLLACRPALLYPPKPKPVAAAPEPLPAALRAPAPPPRRFATADDLPCPRLAARWPWRHLLAKNTA
jgi:hypothetical protein